MLKSSTVNLPYTTFKKSFQYTFQQILSPHYTIQKQIGRGQHSIVYKAHDNQNNTFVAIKIIDLKKYQSDYIDTQTRNKAKNLSKTQAQNLSRVNSKFIVKFYQTFQNYDHNFRIIVMEYCEGPTLAQYIIGLQQKQHLQLTEYQVLQILTHIIAGIHALHANNLIHRDLHPGNIMKSDNRWVIVDLGFSKFLKFKNQNHNHTRLGTLYTMAPQVLSFQPYGFKADIWSIGILAFFMLTAGYFLIQTQIKNYDKDIIMKLIKDKLQLQFPSSQSIVNQQKYSKLQIFKRSSSIIQFLASILVFEENLRISLENLQQHQIFKQYSFDMNSILQTNTKNHANQQINTSNDINYYNFTPNDILNPSQMQNQSQQPLPPPKHSNNILTNKPPSHNFQQIMQIQTNQPPYSMDN